MFHGLRMRLRDMGTIRTLCERAEQHAVEAGQSLPGAEHFLLAALDLSDGTAAEAFVAVGADPASFREAILLQHRQALARAGCEAGTVSASTMPAPVPIFDAAPSGQEVLQALAADRDGHRPLLGAHVVEVVAAMKHGVAARSLLAMNVEREALRQAAARIAASANAG